jgi:tape measure domain
MADGRVVIDVILDDSSVAKGVANIEKKLGGIQGTASKVVSGLARVGAAVGAAIGAAGLAVGKIGLEFNAMKEQSMVAWTTLLGSAKEAQDMLKRISDLAKSTPFETEDVDIMAKYMHNAGLSGDQLFKTLTRISDVSSAFAIPAAEAREMARQMSQVMQAGVAYTEDLNILQDRGVPIYKAISEQLGVTVADVRKLASEGKVTSDIYIAAFDNIAKGVDGASQAQSQTFSGMISTFKDNIKILAGELTEGLFNRVKGGFSNVLSLLEDFNEGLQNGGLMGAFEAILPPSVFERFQKFATEFENIFNALKQGDISGAITAASSLINSFIQTIIQQIPTLLQQGRSILQSVINGIVDALPVIIPAALSIIETLINNISSNIQLILTAGTEILLALVDGIIKMLPQLIDTGILLINKIVEIVVENLPRIIDAGIKILIALVEGITDRLPDLVAIGITLLVKLAGAIIRNLPKILAAGGKILIMLINGIIKLIPMLLSLGGELIIDLAGAIGKKVYKLKDVGKDLIKGLWNGIKSVKNWILGKINGFVDDIVGGIKKFFKIGSPSKLMANEVGRWIPAGIAEGIEREEKTAMQAMRRLGASLSTTITPSVNVSNPLRGASLPIGNLVPAGVYSGFSPVSKVAQTVQPYDDSEIKMLLKQIAEKSGDVYLGLEKVGRIMDAEQGKRTGLYGRRVAY